MNIIARFFIILFTLVPITLGASIQRVELNLNNLKSGILNKPNSIFIIRDNLNFNGAKVQIGNNSILQFEGGTISNAVLVSGGGEIIAPKYKIFENCRLEGKFSNYSLPVEWFGAVGDASTDDSKAINLALQNSNGTMVEMSNKEYYIASTIYLNQDYQKLKLQGTLYVARDIVGIDISAKNLDLDLGIIWNAKGRYNQLETFNGIAMLISGNSFHSDIKIHEIKYFDKGIAFVPRVKKNSNVDYAGIQYCKIDFQSITANYCIYFDMLTDHLPNKQWIWINENQIFGGRLIGKYGIYTASMRNCKNLPSPMNGNVFYSIGFEEIKYPIKLWRNEFCSFHDLRMSESIHSDKFFDLEDCNNLTFDIKSKIPYTSIITKNCSQINFSRSFTDEGMSRAPRYDKLYVDDLSVDEKFVYTDVVSKNTFKKLYYDVNHSPKGDLNFNDLFCRANHGQMIMSNICQITVNDGIKLNIDFKGSVYKLHPEMIIRCRVSKGSLINFVNGRSSVGKIDKTGTYKVTFDVNDKVYFIPLSN